MPFDSHQSPDSYSDSDQHSGIELSADALPPSRDTGMMYLHPTSLLFDLLAHGRTYLFPIVLGLFGAANGNVFFLIISGILFIPAVGMSIFRYVTLRYQIQDQQLVVDQGVIFKQTRTVPVSRIQNIDLVQNVLHRLLGVAEVKIETASGTEPEAVLRVLSLAQVDKLRQAIFGLGQHPKDKFVATEMSKSEVAVDSDDPLGGFAARPFTSALKDQSQTVLTIPVLNLLKAGFSSNRGLIMVGILIGGYFQFGNDRDITINAVSWLPEFESTTLLILFASIGVCIALVALRFLSAGWFLMRFFGYRLERHGDDLRISCGLFTKVSATIPRKRVQFISIHRHWMMRLMGLCSIRIETAGGAGEQQNASESVSKRWFIPAMRLTDVPMILSTLRPGMEWDESQLPFQPLAARAATRLTRIAVVISIFVIIIGLLISRPFGFVPGLVILPCAIWWARRQASAMRYARTEQGVVYRSGVITSKVSITFFEKIQTLEVAQNPFDRRWSMARLVVDTAAAGPAEHRISVPYLDAEFAQEEFQRLREMTGKNQPVFG